MDRKALLLMLRVVGEITNPNSIRFDFNVLLTSQAMLAHFDSILIEPKGVMVVSVHVV
jgi:hypothetical protein